MNEKEKDLCNKLSVINCLLFGVFAFVYVILAYPAPLNSNTMGIGLLIASFIIIALTLFIGLKVVKRSIAEVKMGAKMSKIVYSVIFSNVIGYAFLSAGACLLVPIKSISVTEAVGTVNLIFVHQFLSQAQMLYLLGFAIVICAVIAYFVIISDSIFHA